MVIVVVQSFSHIWFFATPWTAAHQASQSFTIVQSLLKYTFAESAMPATSHPLLPPSPPALNLSQHQGLFLMSWLFASGGQSIGTSASASVLPMNIQGWFPLGMTGLISLMPNGLSSVFANTTVWKHQFFSAQPYIHSFLDSFPIWAVTDYWVQFLVLYSSVQLLSHV